MKNTNEITEDPEASRFRILSRLCTLSCQRLQSQCWRCRRKRGLLPRTPPRAGHVAPPRDQREQLYRGRGQLVGDGTLHPPPTPPPPASPTHDPSYLLPLSTAASPARPQRGAVSELLRRAPPAAAACCTRPYHPEDVARPPAARRPHPCPGTRLPTVALHPAEKLNVARPCVCVCRWTPTCRRTSAYPRTS